MAPKAYYTQERRAFLSFPDRIASSSAILFLLLTPHLLTLLFPNCLSFFNTTSTLRSTQQHNVDQSPLHDDAPASKHEPTDATRTRANG